MLLVIYIGSAFRERAHTDHRQDGLVRRQVQRSPGTRPRPVQVMASNIHWRGGSNYFEVVGRSSKFGHVGRVSSRNSHDRTSQRIESELFTALLVVT